MYEEAVIAFFIVSQHLSGRLMATPEGVPIPAGQNLDMVHPKCKTAVLLLCQRIRIMKTK
jgi:hypothetical protein